MVTPGKNGKKKSRRRRIDFVDLLITVILFLIVFLVFTVVLIIVYPGAARNAADNILSPESRAGKSLSKIGDRARDGITYRFAPIANGFKGVFLKNSSKKKNEENVQAVVVKIDVDECLKCHVSLFDQEAFNHIYVQHRQHAAANIPCQSCHAGTEHPKPKMIKEAGCRGCHKKLGVTEECSACHTPGSVLDERVIPKEKMNAFFAGRTSSQKVLVPVGFQHPVGDYKTTCMQCHEGQVQFCDRCHNTPNNGILSTPHKEGWIPTHGPKILKNELSITDCLKCHSLIYCGGACHPNPNRQRIFPAWPLPRLELKE